MSNNTEDGSFNRRSPAVKRILREAAEMCDSTYEYYAQPLEDNLFEWHFTIRGGDETEFRAGIYHGRILLPSEWPMKPPSIIILTPNGRFKVGTKICLSISGHHPETWLPSWSIRTVLTALTGFMPTKAEGLGSLDYSPEERKILAKQSRHWKCPQCGPICALLKESKTVAQSAGGDDSARQAEETALADFMANVSFQGEKTTTASATSENDPKEEAQKETAEASGEPMDASASPTPPSPFESSSPSNNESTGNATEPRETQQPEGSSSGVSTTTTTSSASQLDGPLISWLLTALVVLIVAVLFRRALLLGNLIWTLFPNQPPLSNVPVNPCISLPLVFVIIKAFYQNGSCNWKMVTQRIANDATGEKCVFVLWQKVNLINNQYWNLHLVNIQLLVLSAWELAVIWYMTLFDK